MRLSNDIHNFITEIVDVYQQFDYEGQKFKKIVSLLMRYVN